MKVLLQSKNTNEDCTININKSKIRKSLGIFYSKDKEDIINNLYWAYIDEAIGEFKNIILYTEDVEDICIFQNFIKDINKFYCLSNIDSEYFLKANYENV